VSPDLRRVGLQIDGCQAGYVTMVRALDVRNREGRKLRRDTFHYTLNQIPARLN